MLLGWGLDPGWLSSAVPPAFRTGPDAAAGLALCGLAMLLRGSRQSSEALRWAIRILAALALLIGGLTLGAAAFGWSVGINGLLWREIPGAINTPSPVRMSPVTAYCVVLQAAALLLAARRRPDASVLTILSTFGATLVVITGHQMAGDLWMLASGQQFWQHAGMALPAVGGLMALGLGTLAWAARYSHHHWTLDRWTTIGLAGGLISVLLASGLAMALDKQPQTDAYSSAGTSFLLLPVGVDLGLTLLILMVFSLNRANGARLRSQLALSESEAQLDAIFNTMSDGIVVRDLQGHVVRANRYAWEVMNEFNPGMGPGDPNNNVEFFLPDGQALPYEQWPSQRARRGEFVHNLELIRRKPSTGQQVWQEFNSAPIDSPHGGPRQTVVSFRDITERREAEAARDQIEGIFRGIFEETPDCIVVADPQRSIIMANPSAHRMFGYPPKGMIGVSTEMLAPAEMHASLAAERASLVNNAHSHRIGKMWEFDGMRKDGTRFALELRRTALVTAHGIYMIAVGREIEERRRVEEARARLTAIIANSQDAIIGKDLLGVIYSWNEGAQTIFGYTAQEMIGESVLRLLPDDRLAEEEDILAHIARGDSVPHFDTVRKTKDGRLIDVSISVSPIRNAAGEVVGASRIARDVTQTRLLQAQLRESQKMEAIGVLASGIAHDFNNILGALLGNVELAEQDMRGHSSAMDSLQEVRKAGRRARDLVQQILAFGRRQDTRRQVTSLSGVVEESVRMLRATLPARISLQSTFLPGTPEILADVTQVQQVLINLGTNAVHALQGRSGLIDVRVEPCEVDDPRARHVAALRPGPHARVIFSDTGQGMDATTLSRIFEPFFTTKAQGEGTGLGLSVVHGIMRDHEGAIAVHSEPGKGTRFELYFPAAASMAPQEPVHVARTEPHEGGRLLYIDDDEAMVYLVRRMMGRRGYHVSGFSDSALALESLRNGPARYDLAITDYNMPGLSGTEVAAEIRRLRPDLPVALVSGYITDDMRTEAARAGVREVLVKANVAEEFCDAVQRLLQRNE